MPSDISIQLNLIQQYRNLINVILPSVYKSPVKFNHCFNRVILDWLFKDCWYYHLNKNKTAISQLSNEQLQLSVTRMNEWLSDQNLLIADNLASLQYRKKLQSHQLSF